MHHGSNDASGAFAHGDIFAVAITDAELEAAAHPGAPALAALSFPNAPTVSILVYCCGNDSSEQG
jgi:hypothetical protein